MKGNANIVSRILPLLRPDERRKGMKVVAAVFLRALLDFAGLAALLPVLFFLLDEGGDRSRALWFCLLAGVFILLKNLLSVGLARYQNNFLLALYRRLSLSLFTSYYRRGLLFIREKGSVKLAHEVNFVCYAFSLNILSPLLYIGGEVLLLLLVTVALLVYAPLTVLLLYGVFLPFVWIYSRSVRKEIRRNGEQELRARRSQSMLVTGGLRGYAELELNDAFPTLLRTFSTGLEKISDSRVKMETLGHVPACLSEVAVIVGLTLLTAFGTGDIRAITGVFAVASFRLLPALRGILHGWTQVQNSAYCLQVIEEGLDDVSVALLTSDRCTGALPFSKDMELKHLSFAYPDGNCVLDDFSCTIRKGEYVGISGASGIGKSTLFNLLLGFLTPDEGEITIDGTRLDATTRPAWHKRVGYVQQEVFILDGTLAENIALGSEDIDREKMEKVLAQVCLDEWVATLSQGIDTPLGEGGGRLSGGQRQRVGIARALYKEVDVLLLDEATSALDDETERAIHDTLLRLKQTYEGLTLLVIAHRKSTLTCCQRIITLNEKENG